MKKFILLATLFCAAQVHAQSVTTLPLASTSFCQTDSLTISYQAQGSFGAKNVFSVQLSDATGAFGAFTNIGSLKTTTSSSIKVGLPSSAKASSAYRIRVIASTPYTVGSDNGTNLTIASITPFGIGTQQEAAGMMEPVQFKAFPGDNGSGSFEPGSIFEWEFGADASPSTSQLETPPPVLYSTPGEKSAKLTVQNAAGCSMTRASGNVMIMECFPKIPANARVIDIDTEYGGNGGSRVVWIRPGAHYHNGAGMMTFFVEPGAIIEGGGGSCTFYLKAGSQFSSGGGSHTIVFEEGASIGNTNGTLIPCSDLEFNYIEAPPVIHQASVATFTDNDLMISETDGIVSISGAGPMRHISIYDILGRLVIEKSGPLENASMDLRAQPAGRYILRVDLGGRSISRNLTISR